MMKKILTKIIVITFIAMFIGIDIVSAAPLNVHGSTGGSGSTGTPKPSTIVSEEAFNYSTTSGNRITHYSCDYKWTANTWAQTTLNLYDNKNTSLIPKDVDQIDNYQLLAGTMIGVALTDIRTTTWSVKRDDIKVKARVTQTVKESDTYQCIYQKTDGEITLRPVNSQIDNPVGYRLSNDLEYTGENNIIQIVKPSLGCNNNIVVDNPSDCPRSTTTCEYIGTKTIKGEEREVEIEPATPSNDEEAVKKCIRIAMEELLDPNTYVGANNIVQKWGAAFKMDFTDSNNINETNFTISADEINDRRDSWACYNEDDLVNPVYCGFGGKTDSEQERYIQDVVNRLYNMSSGEEITDKLLTYREYIKEKTCINVKTGIVSYVPSTDASGRTKTDCDSTEELTIENDVITNADGTQETHWHYFIPLNAKSTDGVNINAMLLSSNKDFYYYSKSECENYLEQNPLTYDDMIVLDNNGETENFTGDLNCGLDVESCKVQSKDWLKLSKITDPERMQYACRFSTVVNLPIKQLFYNEVTTASSGKETTSRFNGFNFYYKPIDISKSNQIDIIFPNGVNTNSSGELTTTTLWDEWYQEQKDSKSTLDLSESFSKETYRASNIKYSEVRTYNEDNPYTSWSKMNIDGTSQFVGGTITGDTENIITRVNVDTNEIYKLGCGPLNENEYLDELNQIENPLYIKGCEPKK